MDTKELWRSQAEKLSNSFRVLTFDLRGHGESDKPEIEYSISLLAEDLFQLLNRLSIKGTAIIGHSMGGMIAQEFCLKHQDEMSTLILCSTASSGVETVTSGFDIPTLVDEIKTKGFDKMISESASSWFTASIPSSLVDFTLRENLKTSPYAAVSCLKAMLDWDARQKIQNIKILTLIVVGEEDAIIPPSLSRKLHEKIPKSELVTIKNCGHMVYLENPNELNKIIKNFSNSTLR